MVKVKIDMTGWKMWEHGVPDSRLTVIGRAEDRIIASGRKYSMWLCACNCDQHNQVILEGSSIRAGRVKSCGCLHGVATARRHQAQREKNNISDLSGEYGIILSTNTNEEIYFDLENADKILQHSWMIDDCGYPTANINDKPQRMHVFLGYKWHDHHNRNKLDNRKCNLVQCTIQENVRNGSIRSNNKSGVIGVYKHTKYDRWIAQIKFNDKITHLGTFKNKEDAIKARLCAEYEHFGEFSPQRHLFEEYGIK